MDLKDSNSNLIINDYQNKMIESENKKENDKNDFPLHRHLQNSISFKNTKPTSSFYDINKKKQKINHIKIKRLKSNDIITKNKKLKLDTKNLNPNENLETLYTDRTKTINNKELKEFHALSHKNITERRNSQSNLKYNSETIDKESEKAIDINKNNLNSISIYSTHFNNDELKPSRSNKIYYVLNNKKKEKKRLELLRASYNFNKFNNDRALIQMITKFKNKEEADLKINYEPKHNLFSYLKRIPTKVAFGKGTSTIEIPEIDNNFNFNKIRRRQRTKKKNINEKLNNLFSHGYNLKTDGNILKNHKNFSEEKKSIFITNSHVDKIPKDRFGNEIYPVLTKHKILRNILPKEVDYNTKTSIQDIVNNEIHPLLRFQKKIMSQSSNLISQELNALFSKYICLSNMESDKQEIYKRNDILIELTKDDKFIKLMRGLIGKNKEIEQKLKDKINEVEKKKKEERRRYLLKRFKQIIEMAREKIKKYKIDVQIFFSLMEIDRTTDAYKKEFRNQGQYLFRVIKANDINEITNVINKNVDLVSYKDDFNQIPLHICAKRNIYEIIAFLLSRLSPIDAQDECGRTPLMLAAKNNYLEFVTILLFENANPMIKDKNNQKASDMTTNPKIHLILKRAEVLYNFHLFLEGKNLHKYIFNGLDYLYKKELEINYEKWIYKGLKVMKDASQTFL